MAFSRDILYILMVLGWARSGVASNEARVSIKLYYESDCPACGGWILEQLGPLYNEDGGGTFKSNDQAVTYSGIFSEKLKQTFPASESFGNNISANFVHFSGVIDLQLFPYGNANEKYNPDNKTWVFDCQHGEGECQGEFFLTVILISHCFKPNIINVPNI